MKIKSRIARVDGRWDIDPDRWGYISWECECKTVGFTLPINMIAPDIETIVENFKESLDCIKGHCCYNEEVREQMKYNPSCGTCDHGADTHGFGRLITLSDVIRDVKILDYKCLAEGCGCKKFEW